MRDLGRALGYAVWVASKDRRRPYGGGPLCEGCLDALPPALEAADGADAVRLIDVPWLEPGGERRVVAAFEVEHTTSIRSCIVRMLDLALGGQAGALEGLFLVAPDSREGEVRAHLARPAFRRVADLRPAWLPYGELAARGEVIARFGSGMKAVRAVGRSLT